MRRVYIGRIVSAILVLIGFAVLFYPSAAAWTTQYYQGKLLKSVHEQIKHIGPVASKQIAEAEHYNAALKSGARLAPNEHVPLSDVRESEQAFGIADYFQILNIEDSGIMGRIIVPAADVDIPIYHGATEDTLLKGAGHLQGTSFPVGGLGTRSVITAHRGLASATMFTNLDQVEIGDEFTLAIFDKVLVYRVIETKVVAPEDSEQIKPDLHRDLVTLVTCTPLGINSHRILVTGERVMPTPKDNIKVANDASSLPHFPWFAVYYSCILFCCIGIIWHSARGLRRLRREAKSDNVPEDLDIS